MNRMLTFCLSVFMITIAYADDYVPGVGFNVTNKLKFHDDTNFSAFTAVGAEQVEAGMDFDSDGKKEILFTVDETLVPGGPDPGYVGIYLYESDGAGGYAYVWHFVSPDLSNSLPGVAHGDIDGDGKHEIYFGVAPSSANDATWGTYIFEQDANGAFPAQHTLLHRYGLTTADNFRASEFAIVDVDGDGKTELVTTDRGGGMLSIDALAGTGALDNLASFTNEFMNDISAASSGAIHDMDVVDSDRDGRHEIWINTWDEFSFTVFESTGPDTYVQAVDLAELFPGDDPFSFNRHGLMFKDVDMDDDLDAWLPMSDGKLYYFENSSLDSIAPNTLTQGGVDGGTSDWVLTDSIAVWETGDTLLYTTSIDTITITAADSTTTDSLVYDTTLVAFAASEGTKALALWAGTGDGTTAHFNVTSPAAGSQFYASVHVLPGHAGYTYADGGEAVFFVNFKDAGGANVGAHSDMMDVSSTLGTSNSWTPLDVFATVPAGAATVDIGVKYSHTASAMGEGSIFVDAMEMNPVAGNGVAGLTAADFKPVLTFGPNGARGGDMGDLDGDSKPDFVVGTGTNESLVWIEYIGSDPKDPMSYTMTTILTIKGNPLDRFYPLDIVDGSHEIVVSNLYSANASQDQIIVLSYEPYSWDSDGGNETAFHLAPGWTIAGYGTAAMGDTLLSQSNTARNNTRTAIGGMDMDQDGRHEVVTNDYNRGAVVYEYDPTANAFDVVWQSPALDSTNNAYSSRAVQVGDLDGDGRHEIVFASADKLAEGYHIYEWDGVAGSDNYGTTYSSKCDLEVQKCCGEDGAAFRGDHENITIVDIDGDGQQELITAIRRGSPRGILIASLGATDDIVHNSGGSLETWTEEFYVDQGGYGGGSPYHALPADLNGDGKWELVNHTWNNLNFFNIAATDENTYEMAAADDPLRHYKATPLDQHSIWGGRASDVDGDGNHEAYFSTYGAGWGYSAGKGELYVVDYDDDEDVTKIGPEQVHRVGIGGNLIGDVGNAYDGHTRPYIFTGSNSSKIMDVTAFEYIGPNPSSGTSYIQKPIYYGELDVANITKTDSAGTTLSESHSRKWGFPSKIQTHWGGDLLDFDGDNKKEILLSYQSVPDSLKTTTNTWNADSAMYIATTLTVENPKNWEFVLLENGSDALGTDPITFIAPEEYRLEQNYPNPFNPNTMIRYTVPIDRKVSVKIYNVNGQLVNTLINNKLVSAGTHEVIWRGNNKNGLKVSTGMYFYSLEWAGMKKVKRMTLLK